MEEKYNKKHIEEVLTGIFETKLFFLWDINKLKVDILNDLKINSTLINNIMKHTNAAKIEFNHRFDRPEVKLILSW